MPGFAINGGEANQNKNNKVETRRKHRWRFTAGFLSPSEWVYLEKAARPSFKFETPEMHHDQEVAFFAGKQSFEDITLEFYDTINPDLSGRLYEWIAGGGGNSVGNLNGEATVMAPNEYKTKVRLELTDGKGAQNEQWELYGAWPSSTNWNDLDYSSTEIQRISVTLKFDRAVKVS